MIPIKGIYDGNVVRPSAKVHAPQNTEVIIIFPDGPHSLSAQSDQAPGTMWPGQPEAVARLRGHFKGALSTTTDFMRCKRREKDLDL